MRPTTPEDIARAVLDWARIHRKGAPPYMVVDEYLRLNKRWSPDFAVKVRSAIGHIGGDASAKSAEIRAKHERKREERARQFKLDL